MRDLGSNIKISRAISPVNAGTGDTAIVSQIIDTVDYDSLEFVIATGSLSDSDATFTALVEDGDNSALSDNAAVVDKYLIGTETGASFTFTHDNAVRKIGYIGPKRYVRLTITPANNTGDVFVSAVAVQGHPKVAPTDQ